MKTINTIPDEIFAESLDRLQNGESISAISDSYPAFQQELVTLLSVADMGLNIKKIDVPVPYKAYRFADQIAGQVAASRGFTEWLSYFRVAVIPIALVAVLFGGRTVVDATEDSIPGEKLYTLKRASEQARLTLTRDQDAIASLHVELLQKRIDEVKKAADQGNENSETLAIAELKTQTEKTFAEVGPLATTNAISKQDSTLLDNLVAINKQQKDVLAELSETSYSDNAKMVASTALEETKKTDVTLAKIIATVNDQALADMPNKVSITGTITYYGYGKVTVEKNIFTINEETTFTAIDGANIPTADLVNKYISGRVSIVGTRVDDGNLIAKQIVLMAAEVEGQEAGTVKGIVTTKPSVKPKPIEPIPTNPEPTQPDPTTPAPAPTPEPNTATGGYITEPSEHQYSN